MNAVWDFFSSTVLIPLARIVYHFRSLLDDPPATSCWSHHRAAFIFVIWFGVCGAKISRLCRHFRSVQDDDP